VTLLTIMAIILKETHFAFFFIYQNNTCGLFLDWKIESSKVTLLETC